MNEQIFKIFQSDIYSKTLDEYLFDRETLLKYCNTNINNDYIEASKEYLIDVWTQQYFNVKKEIRK